MTLIVIEDDPVLRLAGLVLDPGSLPERNAAFAAYMRHDLPDFDGWLARTRERIGPLYPAQVVFVRSEEHLLQALPGADALILEDLPLRADMIAQAGRLRVVQRFGAVVRSIDIPACESRGIRLLTLRRRTNIAVAEHAVALMMALSKRLHQIGGRVSDERLAEGGFSPAPFDTRHSPGANWGRVSGLRTLHGSRLGLIGFGEIGREVARLGRGLGMEVAYHQRTRLSADDEARLGVRYLSLNDLMSDSDIISIHVPKEVENLVDAQALSRVKPGALLINVARAASVEREALLAALRDGRLGGAGMDVHYREPVPPDDPFLSLDNVILTPHLAGASRLNGLQDMSDMLAGLGRALAEAGR